MRGYTPAKTWSALVLVWSRHFLLDDNEAVVDGALTLAATALPIGIGIGSGIGILRHRLFDIGFLLSRTLVYGTLTALVVAAYAGLVRLGDGTLGHSSIGGLLAVGLIAARSIRPPRRCGRESSAASSATAPTGRRRCAG